MTLGPAVAAPVELWGEMPAELRKAVGAIPARRLNRTGETLKRIDGVNGRMGA